MPRIRRGPIEAALARSLRDMPLVAGDAAVRALAETYAHQIDTGEAMLSQVGRQFLETLMQLGLTPKTRMELLKGAKPIQVGSPLDELRARRERQA